MHTTGAFIGSGINMEWNEHYCAIDQREMQPDIYRLLVTHASSV